MARERAPFTQAEIERVLRAAERRGWGSVGFTSPGGGTFRIDKDVATVPIVASTPFDDWKAKQDARST